MIILCERLRVDCKRYFSLLVSQHCSNNDKEEEFGGNWASSGDFGWRLKHCF